MLEYILIGGAFAFAAAVQPGPLQAFLLARVATDGRRFQIVHDIDHGCCRRQSVPVPSAISPWATTISTRRFLARPVLVSF